MLVGYQQLRSMFPMRKKTHTHTSNLRKKKNIIFYTYSNEIMRHFLKSFRYNPRKNQYDVGALRYRLVDGWRRGLQIGLLNNKTIQRISFQLCPQRRAKLLFYFFTQSNIRYKNIFPWSYARLLLLLLCFSSILIILKSPRIK